MHNILTTFSRQEECHTRAFTLIESLVAISILLIAVVGPMSAISTSLSQIKIARDQMIAVNLAHEGIEAVRQIRGSNMLKEWSGVAGWGGTGSWRTGINSIRDQIVLLSSGVPGLNSCGGGCSGVDIIIYKETATGNYYQFSSVPAVGVFTPTQFRRIVRLERTDNREIEVLSTVTWTTSNGLSKSVQVRETVFSLSH